MKTLRTPRLVMRPWTDADVAPFAALNTDPRVMEHFPKLLTLEETEAMVARIRRHFEAHSYGLWALEVPGVSDFIGFAGLNVPTFSAHFIPCVEIGWRLRRDAWGRGYATEAAREVLRHGFETLGLDEVVSFTAVVNEPSRAVMRRIGMRHDAAGDFDHVLLDPGHPLQRHVLYRLRAEEWRSSRAHEVQREGPRG